MDILSKEEVKIFIMLVKKIQVYNEKKDIKFGNSKDEVRSIISRDNFERQSPKQNFICSSTLRLEDSKSETSFSDSERIGYIYHYLNYRIFSHPFYTF